MTQKRMLDETVRHAIEETWAVLSGHDTQDAPSPALFLVRLADLARSNAFLWAEATLQVQEHSTRTVQIGQTRRGLSRSLVLATVAADTLVSYTSFRPAAGRSRTRSTQWHHEAA